MHSPLVVLGGGPAGYAAAFLAADRGTEVTLVDPAAQLGGTCLRQGCIPSKALLHVAHVLDQVDDLTKQWGIEFGSPRIELEQLRARKQAIIEMLGKGLAMLAKNRKVTVIRARGIFESSTSLRLEGEDNSIPDERLLTFDHCLVATGSLPARPSALAIESPRILDSTAALEMRSLPASLLVIGGGYIGLELGTVYAKLGTQVTVVEMTNGLLPGADRDLVRPLKRRLERLFEKRILLETQVAELRDTRSGVEVELQGAQAGRQTFEQVLVAVGRRPATSELGLENTQIKLDASGFIPCDAQQRTADAHILAAGDVAGEPMLAHKATHQAKIAISALLGDATEFRPAAIPAVVFTDPEIAWAGLTQDQAKREERAIEVSIFPWAANGRAQTTGRADGLTKWIMAAEDHRILGCGMVGSGAGELIGEAVVAIEKGCRPEDIAQSIHPHPTLSETLPGAADVFLGTATEIYKPRR